MSQRKPLVIGPFAGGLNLYDDPTAIRDTECVEALNFEPGLDGSLMSRPPFQDLGSPLPLAPTGNATPVGVFYAESGLYYLIATDGLSSTYYYFGGAWTLLTNTFAASAMAQFDGKAWLVSPIGEVDPGGYWTPSGGFIADTDMPHGDAIISYNFRLWVARGKNATQGTRIHYSKALGQPSFWAAAGFIDVGAGDGQSIVGLAVYYNSLVIFRTRSIYTIQYATDPAQATVQVLVPGVGLENKYCLVSDENYLYFFYDGNAYQFINNQVQQINVKVPFEAENRANVALPLAVSIFGKRVLYSFYDTIYLFSLRTRTWTRWRSKQHGAIGKIVSPVSPNTQDAAYALSSKAFAPVGQKRTNLCQNPGFLNNTTGWGGSTGVSGIARMTTTLDGHGVYCEVTGNQTGVVQARYDNGVTVGEAIPAGATSLTVQTHVRGTVGTRNSYMGINWYLADGTTQVGAFVRGPDTPIDATKWTAVYLENSPVPPTAVRFKVYVRISNAASIGETFYFDDANFEVGPTPPKPSYFDGGKVDTATYQYDWLGTSGNSQSTQTYILRGCPLLFIADDSTGVVEFFDCVLQTKNYNFELPSNFKRLFWWGLDAIFRGEVRGEAIPIVYAQKPTWGQLLAQGITWRRLLGGTWGSPLTEPIEVETDYNLSNVGPTRKFVKFRKGLRFRQIGFRVTFPVDGTILTLPIYVFSLTAHVVTREGVVKAIS